MKILIHGSTYTTNFGDVLFAKLFYDTLKRNCDDVQFLTAPKIGISDFFRKEIGYTERPSLMTMLKSDKLVMLSGGYLGENKYSHRNSLARYIRYILPVRIFQLLGKPVYFVGVGGGPLLSNWLQKACVRAINNAEYISVRDIETLQYMKKYGVKKNMVLTSDTALVLSSTQFSENKLFSKGNSENKFVFFHYVNQIEADTKLSERVIPALNRFLEEHKEYIVVFGCDEVVKKEDMVSSSCYKLLPSDRCILCEYTGVVELCDTLNNVNFIITPKLHVGIVGTALNTPVVSFPIHREKTERFYRQLGEENRSIHIDKIDSDIAYSQINVYHNRQTIVSDEIKNMAFSNLQVLIELSGKGND